MLPPLHIIRALPPDVVASIRDITRHLTAESLDAYDIVKQALLERFTTSELQRCYQLLDAPALGDRNIAAHYDQLRAIIPANGDILFNAIFLRTLPEHIRLALASQAELPSSELAAAAARMQHSVHSTAVIAAATPLPQSPPPSVVSAATQRPSRQYNRSSPSRHRRDTPHHRRSNSCGRRRSTSNNSARQLCWYHQQFGSRARCCEPQNCSSED
jgi:hypothetical protein